MAQPSSLLQASVFCFLLSSPNYLCCCINLPRAWPQSYPMLSYSHITQYTLSHNHVTPYQRSRVTWYHTIMLYTIIIYYMSHSLHYYSVLSHISDTTCYILLHDHFPYYHILHFTWYTLSYNHITYKNCYHWTVLKDPAHPPILSIKLLPWNTIEIKIFFVARHKFWLKKS